MRLFGLRARFLVVLTLFISAAMAAATSAASLPRRPGRVSSHHAAQPKAGARPHHPRPQPRFGSANATNPFFSLHSFWNRTLPVDAPLDPSSTRMISELHRIVRGEAKRKNGPWIDASSNGVTIVTATAGQRTVGVELDHSPDAALTSAWRAVPLPASTQPPSGDGDVVVWQPSHDRMWEFFHLSHRHDGWHAEWGGAMQNVSANSGVYGPHAWPGAKNWWGVTATSLPVVGGAMTLNELAAGQINHALALAVPNVRGGVFASPARRDDGVLADRSALPEGAHLRLDPNLNLASMKMPPLVRMMAVAAQRYGIIIRDHSPIVSFFAQNPVWPEPNVVGRLYQGLYPWQLLYWFPWAHLHVLRLHLHKRS
jgi:hypothetical protein